MTTLYTAPGAAGLVVHWLLIELEVPHELRLLDFAKKEQKSPEYLKLNPAGVVPTLVLDGQPLNEAAAIVMHLADTHPTAGLAPALGSVERARYYQWMFFCANTLQPAFRAWWYPSEPAGEANTQAAQASAKARIEAGFERVDAHLAANGPYLLGDRVSAADFMFTMLMRWSRGMPKPATDWPQLAALAARMKARPSFRTLYEREGLTEWA
jgi:glutathione S-transferase